MQTFLIIVGGWSLALSKLIRARFNSKVVGSGATVHRLILARASEDCISEWFLDPHEQVLFIRCMTLITEHDKAGDSKVKLNQLDQYSEADDESHHNPDNNARAESGTTMRRKSTRRLTSPLLTTFSR